MAVVVEQLDAGDVGVPVLIQGSTNYAAGGTQLRAGLDVQASRGLTIRNLKIASPEIGGRGLLVSQSANTTVEQVWTRGFGDGIRFSESATSILRRCAAVGARTNGLSLDKSVGTSWDSGVLWSNLASAIDGAGVVAVSNSILAAFNPVSIVYRFSGTINADYNTVLATNGALVGQEAIDGLLFPRQYENLGRWRFDTGRDPHSQSFAPLLADPAGLDFHERSQAGRYDPTGGVFQLDAATSPAIDAAAPAADYAAETLPNGARRNIGVFGGTGEASRTPTNSVLLAASLSDGGVVSGTNVFLYWLAQGVVTGQPVRIEYSSDAGFSWVVLASNLTNHAAGYVWNTTNFPSSVLALWRVVSQVDTGVMDAVDRPFTVRNSPISFYVNDLATTGDVYCLAPGSATNNGITTLQPMPNIASVLTTYDLEPGDSIFVDTGHYTNASPIEITALDAGIPASNLFVTIQGSTNAAAGGTVVHAGALDGFRLTRADGMAIRDLTVKDADHGLLLTESSDCRLQGLVVDHCTVGVSLGKSPRTAFLRDVIRESAEAGIELSTAVGTTFDKGVLWSNGTCGVKISSGSLTISNSVIGAFGKDQFGYVLQPGQSIAGSEFNCYYLRDGAGLAEQLFTAADAVPFPFIWQNVARWSRDTGLDRRSLSDNPLFADAPAGDFHPLSAGGRYSVTGGVFVIDGATSPLIDAGAPEAAWTNETAPNGGRLDIGLYGDSAQASRSPTNARLLVVAMNAGGRADGFDWPLSWVPAGPATGQLVRLDYSSDAGQSWMVIATNIPARAGIYYWDTPGYPSSARALWRVMSESDTNVFDVGDNLFALRNTNLYFYVNDGSTSGDVYAAAAGQATNSGVTASEPRDSVQSILDTYDIDPGDTIYVDTGSYLLTAPVTVDRFDAWDDSRDFSALVAGGSSLTIRGSTNIQAGGTLLRFTTDFSGISLTQAMGVVVQNLRLQYEPNGQGTLLRAEQSAYGRAEWVTAQKAAIGFEISRSPGFDLIHCVARENSQRGVYWYESAGASFQNGVIWSNTVGTFLDASSISSTHRFEVVNSVIGAFGTGRVAQLVAKGKLTSDYNGIFATNGALVGGALIGGSFGGGTNKYNRLYSWSKETGRDAHSFAGYPAFADPVNSDYHLLSPAGRYVPGSGYITNPLEATSHLIDAGDPTVDPLDEPAPNGYRIEIGLYGGTAQASKTPTNGVLTALTLSDGGAAEGPFTLYWAASGDLSNCLVRLDYSSTGGNIWSNIASGLPATQGSLLWDSEPFGRAAAGLWRVVVEDCNTNTYDVSDRYFALHNFGSIAYYVNDGGTFGDIYAWTTGSETNDGFLPQTPKATLQGILDDEVIEIEPGDVIYVDSGTYPLTADILVDIFSAGQPTNPVIIQGVSNGVGRTIIDRQTDSGSAIHLYQTQAISLRDLTVRGGDRGVFVDQSADCSLIRVVSRENQFNGFEILDSERTRLSQSVSFNNPTNGVLVSVGHFASTVIADGNVIWGSQCGFRFGPGASGQLQNNSISAAGSESRIFLFENGSGNVTSEYNHFYRSGGALVSERINLIGGNDVAGRLIDWQRYSTQDLNTVTGDPLFADPLNGDFHLSSATGRYLDDGTSVTDAPGVFSPLLDAGSPLSAYTNEPSPNGGRINLGNWGNFQYASRSQTNPWLRCLTLNDGGLTFGTNTLRWLAGAMATGATVSVQFAPDGVEYVLLASNLLASSGAYEWDASTQPPTALARWRVVSELYPGVQDTVDANFTIKNSAITVYVNDYSTNSDVYCHAPGAATNTGLSAYAPLDDPSTALARYFLSGGDVVLIDTGEYFPTNEIGLVVGREGDEFETGFTNLPLLIRGSTNHNVGGSSIYVSGTNGFGMEVRQTEFVDVEDLSFFGCQNGLSIADSQYINLRRVDAHNSSSNGFLVSAGRYCRLERCASYNNAGWGLQVAGNLSDVAWEQGTVWSNSAGGIAVRSAALQVSNSVLCSSTTNAPTLSVNGGALRSDYNDYWTENGATLLYDEFLGVRYRTLLSWQKARQLDWRSARLDPLFYDASAGDFHLRSRAGRYDPNMAGFVADGDTSWLIDAGDPARPYSAEPFPNGHRLNVGRHGNSAEASMSPFLVGDRALQVATANDGGSISGPITLYWLSQALTTSDLVRVEVSTDGGFNWVAIASNLNPTTTGVTFDPTGFPSTPIAYWRIALQSDPSINSTNSTRFTIRQGPILYYVNDGSLLNDFICTGPGSATNSGLGPSVPMESIQHVLDEYELEGGTNTYGGDVVYVDAGTYALTNTTVFRFDDKGNAFGNVLVQGSTNPTARTILQVQSTNVLLNSTQEVAIALYNTRNVTLADLTIEHASYGVQVEQLSDNCSLSNLLVRDGGVAGIYLRHAFNTRVSGTTVTRMKGVGVLCESDGGSILDGCVIWSNGSSAVSLASVSGLMVSNSVLHATGTNLCYALLDDMSSVYSDYNDLLPVGLAADFAQVGELRLEGLPQWTTLSGQDTHSLSVDPLFANPATDDFHVQSPYGRYDPVAHAFVTTDTNYSYLVDTGGPGSPYAEEPASNGGLRNIGSFGNTAQASKSQTNAWLMALTGSSGGRATGTFYLAWSAGNLALTNFVSLDYSYDGGTNWLPIASNVSVASRSYLWDSSTLAPFSVSPISVWRLRVQGNTGIWDRTDGTFALNGPFTFYVNDASTNGDVFTFGPGSPSNLGIYSNLPKSSLRDLFAFWDMEGDDQVLVDVGTYLITTNEEALMGQADSGNPSSPVRVQGSFSNGGSRLVRSGAAGTPLLSIAGSFVNVSNLIFAGDGVALTGTNLLLSRVVVSTGNVSLVGDLNSVVDSDIAGANIVAVGSTLRLGNLRMRDCDVDMLGNDISLTNSIAYGGSRQPLVSLSGTNMVVRNNTLLNNGTVIQQTGADSHSEVRNNIIVADGQSQEAFCLLRSSGLIESDYNLFQARRGAWIGSAGGNWERLLYWQAASGADTNSIVADPLFVSEATGDFHLRSITGHYTNGVFAADAVHSPAIDMGAPASGYARELAPNGARVNIGGYGNTDQASLSRPGSWVYAMSLNDGPSVKGSNVLLQWSAGGLSGTNRVTLQYSANNGATWTTIVTGVSIGAGSYIWNSTAVTSSLTARWRVFVEADTGAVDQVDQPFSVRNQVFNFYVNDTSTVGDVYTVAPGLSAYDGMTPATPKPSLSELVTNYDLEGGDTVFVDTGSYPLTEDLRLIWSDSGDATAPVTIRGSTNIAAGGSVFDRGNPDSSGQSGFDVLASYVNLRDLTVRRAFRGLFVNSNAYFSAQGLNLYSNSYGVVISKAQSVSLSQSRVWRSAIGGIDVTGTRTVTVENITSADNGQFHYRAASNTFSVLQNSIFYHSIAPSSRVSFVTGSVVDVNSTFIDYNIYFIAPGSLNGAIYGNITDLTQWQRAWLKDYRSAQTNPLFADFGSQDFHLRSTAGRYQDGFGFVNDSENSWGIDHANPATSAALEPAPNGGRANIGAYGGTRYASKGNTNVFFDVRVLNDAISPLGTNDTPFPFLWSAHLIPSGETVRVEYSGDGGITWQALATNLSAYQEYAVWTLSPLFNTFSNGLVRVVGEQTPSLVDTNNGHIALFFGEHMRFRALAASENTPVSIIWRGSWGEHYQVQYATMMAPGRALNWSNAPLGGASNQIPNFISPWGGDQVYEDPQSSNIVERMYRVIWDQNE